MTAPSDKSAWQAFKPYAPPVIYCLSVAAGTALLALFAFIMGLPAQARADAFAQDAGCVPPVLSPSGASACQTRVAIVETARLATARGPAPSFVARWDDGSTMQVDLSYSQNEAVAGLQVGQPVQLQMWQGTPTAVWSRGRVYATSQNPLQDADAWQTGARWGSLALWLPLLAGAWLALRGWILSREPTDD